MPDNFVPSFPSVAEEGGYAGLQMHHPTAGRKLIDKLQIYVLHLILRPTVALLYPRVCTPSAHLPENGRKGNTIGSGYVGGTSRFHRSLAILSLSIIPGALPDSRLSAPLLSALHS